MHSMQKGFSEIGRREYEVKLNGYEILGLLLGLNGVQGVGSSNPIGPSIEMDRNIKGLLDFSDTPIIVYQP